MNNPYDKNKHEAKYLSWDAGFNSLTKEDNPYVDMQDDPEALTLSNIWMQGFNANKNRPKPVKVKPVQVDDNQFEDKVVKQVNDMFTITSLIDIPTETLLAEVAKRMKDFEETVKRFKKIIGDKQ